MKKETGTSTFIETGSHLNLWMMKN